jgi:coenzyme F420-0:L-glutamate ligase/coenzyme F420-1:gamma-L-glutamate ligase
MTSHDPNPIDAAIRARRSIRGLEGPPVPPEQVEALVALALTAPAPHHTEPWRFVEVSPARREGLADAMGASWDADLERDGHTEARREWALARSRRRIVGAPTLILGCLVAEGLNAYEDDRRARAEWGLAQHSFGAALQNILLGASARGLGAYWISAPLYAPAEVRAALDLDVSWEPQALVCIGSPSADYTPFERPPREITRFLVRR